MRRPWELLHRTAGGLPRVTVRIAFNRDGSRLLAPRVENSIRIWDAESWRESEALYYSPALDDRISIRGLAFSPNEPEVYAATDDARVYRFVLRLDDLIREASRRVGKTVLWNGDCLKYVRQPCPAQLRGRP